MIVAHKSADGRLQPLEEHLRNVAEYAKRFSEVFEAGEYAYVLGLAHDIGKYSAEFQEYLLHEGTGGDHSTAGAKELFRLRMLPASLCAAGHHAGLPDGGGPGDPAGLPTWQGRLKKQVHPYAAYRREITLEAVSRPPEANGFRIAFFTRMLFSALVDADFLDTEAFMQSGAVQRGGYASILSLFDALKQYIDPWLHPQGDVNPINRKCTEILKCCLEAGKGKRGLKSLTVPTGGGKTIASLAFALQHAVQHGLSRVIYVIPYTSIIEQTAKVFRAIVGAENVLEYHANVSFDQQGDDDRKTEKLRLSAENWDAPIIVTTSVQFFESLYANRTSRCRKLHNIANSVVIFDEAQMLPVDYLTPCVRAIWELVEMYGITAVLCTATQPSLGKLFPKTAKIEELCPNTQEMFHFFRRTQLKHIGTLTIEKLAGQMAMQTQVLAIVNTRKQAAELYQALPAGGRFHLSTLMTPLMRRWTLRNIRRRLRQGLVCRVVATSLIEAGVDVDFPTVFRAEAGLDSIIQAAGRCNREGKRPVDESAVYIFRTEERIPPRMQQNVSIFKNEIQPSFSDVASLEAIQAYFDALHNLKGDLLDRKKIVDAFERGRNGCMLPFAQVAKEFRLIEENTKSVFIPLGQRAKRLAQRLQQGECSRSLLRKAGRYMVNVYDQHFQELYRANDLVVVADGLAVLTNLRLYDTKGTGLSLEADAGKALFV